MGEQLAVGRGVMMAIRPEWVWEILDGRKTIEVRKSKISYDPPFLVYVYCTKGGDALRVNRHGYVTLDNAMSGLINGTVCAEFTCDKRYEIVQHGNAFISYDAEGGTFAPKEPFLSGTCMNFRELKAYLKGKPGYLYHITDLKVYDQPKPTTDFYYDSCQERVIHPPQSFCYVDMGDREI